MCRNKSPQYTFHLFPNEKKCREVCWIQNAVLIVCIYQATEVFRCSCNIGTYFQLFCRLQ